MILKNYIYFILVTLITVSCNKAPEKAKHTYLGGVIKNPNSNFIVINTNNKTVDSIFLDQNNRFSYKFKEFTPGIYNFFDGKESQSILIEKGDSLVFRLNTLNFDESLMYSGYGAKENNYLMNLFLENEKEERYVIKLSQLPPLDFEKALNELKNKKIENLEAFIKKREPSPLFKKISRANILFNYYYSKEFYPFARIDKSLPEIIKEIPASFYSFRNTINYNDGLLQNYYPYKSFLGFHFNNIALEEHLKHEKTHSFNKNDIRYNLNRLELINNKINHRHLKNNLMYFYTMRYLNDSKNTADFSTILKSFKEKSTCVAHINRVSQIVDTYKRLKPGLIIPNVKIIDKNNDTLHIHDILNKPSIIYFWTTNNNYHMNDAHKKVAELEIKYPNINFIAINADFLSSKEQSQVLKRNHLERHNEYHFEDPELAKKLLSIEPINNVFLVNKHKQIINPKANMFSIKFEHELKEITP